MKKILAVILFLMCAAQAKAQVSAVTLISSLTQAIPGQQIAVTFTMKGPADFGQYNYDILFSSSNTPDSTAYSSSIGGPMVCTGKDVGFPFFNQGSASNVIVKTVTVPSTIYSGFIIVIASEGSVYLTCSSTNNNASFSIVNTPTPTNTNTKTATSTATNTPTVTNTATVTPTPTNTNTFTITPTPTNTNTATVTSTPTNTFTLTNTKTPTITNTPYPTLTPGHLPVDNYIQVTATGTVTGQLVWIPQPANGSTSVSGGTVGLSSPVTDAAAETALATISYNTGALQYTATFTFTPTITPTPTNTGTPTNTATVTSTFTPTNTATVFFNSVATWVVTPGAGHTFQFSSTNTYTNISWEISWTGIGGAATFQVRELNANPLSTSDINAQAQVNVNGGSSGNSFGNFSAAQTNTCPANSMNIFSVAAITPTPGGAWTLYIQAWNVKSAFYRERELYHWNANYQGIYICQTRHSSFETWSCPRIINKNEWPWWKWIFDSKG